MKLNHYGKRSNPTVACVIDDFGTEHDIITGDGDFGDIFGASFDQAALFMSSEMQEPEAFHRLWGAPA